MDKTTYFMIKLFFSVKRFLSKTNMLENCMLKDLAHVEVHDPVYWQLIWATKDICRN